MKLIAIISFLFFATSLNAQDTLHFRSGNVLPAKILKVGQKTIVYKKHSNINGPDYEVSRNKVIKVVYENGETDFFTGVPSLGAKHPRNKPDKLEDYGKNIVNTNYMDWLFKKVSLSYERILGEKGMLGLKGTFSLGFGTDRYTPGNTVWGTELEFHIYPGGQKRFTYYLSPMITFGEGRFRENGGYYNDQGGYWVSQYNNVNRNYYGFYLGHGFRFSPTKHFDTSLMFALGMRRDYDFSPTRVNALIQANVGYRF